MKRILLAAAIACSLLASCSVEEEPVNSTYRAKDINSSTILPVIVYQPLDVYKVGDTVEINSHGVIRTPGNRSRDTTVRTVVLQARHQPIQLVAN